MTPAPYELLATLREAAAQGDANARRFLPMFESFVRSLGPQPEGDRLCGGSAATV